MHHPFRMQRLRFLIYVTLFSGSALFARQTAGFVHLAPWPDSLYTATVDDSLPIDAGTIVIPLSPGWHTLRLTPRNTRRWRLFPLVEKFKVPAQDTLFLSLTDRIRMIRPSFPKFTQPVRPVKARFAIPFYSRRYHSLQPALIATSVLANWSAFYIKRRADHAYSQYLRTSDLTLMRSKYRKARNLDNVSSVLLGISAAALTSYLFLLIWD